MTGVDSPRWQAYADRGQPARDLLARVRRGPLLSVAKAGLRLAGLRITGIDSEPEMSGHLRRLLERLSVDCVLDVGANRGQFAALLRRDARYAGRIVSFEPLVEAFTVLQESRRKDRYWTGRREALGSQSGSGEMNVFQTDNFASFLPSSDFGRERLWALQEVVRTETVVVRRLDEIWDEVTRGAKNIFLKMDTQGRDLDVLAGAGVRVEQLAGLMTEVPVQQLYDGMTPFTDTMAALLDQGFDITGLFPETHDVDMRVMEFNCVMRRRR